MGVLGLWQLLTPVGQPVALESLENKILAVDVSIWLHQAVKGYRDAKGGAVANAHLLSLFSRLCKLLFYKIRPIIVFDGGVPELKRQTVINRQQRRNVLKNSSRDADLKLIANYMATKNIENACGNKTQNIFFASKGTADDDIFHLPPISQDSETLSDVEDDDLDGPKHDISVNDVNYLNNIDFESKDFDILPVDIKQEILSTLKERRKHKNWEYYDNLPKESEEFSSYQMQGLLKRRRLQNKLEEIQRDVQKSQCMDIISMYTDQKMIGESSKIMSDDCSHYILLKKSNVNKDEMLEENFKHSLEEKFISSKVDGIQTVKEECDDAFSQSNVSEEKDNFLNNLSIAGDSVEVDEYEEQDPNEMPNDNESPDESSTIVLDSNDRSNDNELPDEPSATIALESNDGSNDNHVLLDESKVTKDIADFSETRVTDLTHEAEIVTEYCDTTISSSDDDSMELVPDLDVFPYQEKATVSKNAHETNQFVETEETFTIEDSDAIIREKVKADERIANDVDEVFYMEPSCSSDMPAESFPSLKQELLGIQLAVQKELEEESLSLLAEKAKVERQAKTVQDNMVQECQHLLRLFGVPYVVSPMEAEAQCAFYDLKKISHGTITDDSDIWLFGGKRVYKNFFAQKKFVEFYKDCEISSHFGLNRTKLINFAMLTGSDYSEGIDGVGRVTAMEIISEFGADGIDSLREFKSWWEQANKVSTPPKNKVRAKLQKLPLSKGFPNKCIFDAYLDPEVDDSTESFSWGCPDLDSLREYCREKFAWNKTKVDSALQPVLKRLNERMAQTHLDSFFTINLKKEKNLFPSKRIMSALKKMKPESKNDDDPESRKKVKQSKKKVSKKNCTEKKSNVLKNKTKKQIEVKKNDTKVKQVLDLSEDSD